MGGRRPRPDKKERKGDGEKEMSKRSDARKDGGKKDKGGRKDGEGGRRPKPDSDCDEDGKGRKDGEGGRRPRPDKKERKGDGEKEVSKRSDARKDGGKKDNGGRKDGEGGRRPKPDGGKDL